MENLVTIEEQKILLQIARESIAEAVSAEKPARSRQGAAIC